MVTFHIPKPERLALSKMWTSIFRLSKGANQHGGFEYNFRCLKRFFRKVRRKLRSAFFLKLRFLKIRFLVTWLKCLLADGKFVIKFIFDCKIKIGIFETSVRLNFSIFDFGTNLGVAIGQCLIKIILTLNRDRLDRNIKCVKFQ